MKGFNSNDPKEGSAGTKLGGKYLTFVLAEEAYGIGILKIKEIIGMRPITSVPQLPHFMKGVINLRGKIIPIIDLRLRFGFAPVPYNERTCIIVVEISLKERSVEMGIVVDAVSEVLTIRSEQIEPTPEFGSQVDASYLLGIAKAEDGVKILLDIDKVLSDQEIATLEKAA